MIPMALFRVVHIRNNKVYKVYFPILFFMPLPLVQRHAVFRLSIHLSVYPCIPPTDRLTDHYPNVWPTNWLSFHPSIRPRRFLGIFFRTLWRNGLKFGRLIYPDHLQNWLDFSHGLLIFLILAPLWLRDSGHIWDLQAFLEDTWE